MFCQPDTVPEGVSECLAVSRLPDYLTGKIIRLVAAHAFLDTVDGH